MRSFNVLIYAALPCALALPWDGPEPTATLQVIPELLKRQHLEPRATAKPRFAYEEFAKRQTTSSRGSSSSPGGTCGFLDGSSNDVFTCSSNRVCAIVTQYNAYGCCLNPPNCPLSTSCVAYSALPSCAADSNCAADNYLTKCDTSNPYCNQLILSGGANAPATAWQCDSTPASLTLLATATDGDKGTASLVFVQLSIPTRTSSTTTSSLTSSSTTSTSSSTTTSITPTPTPVPKKKAPIGAIVGGTVGGVVAIAALLIAAFCLWKRSKSHGAAPVPQQPPQELHGGMAGYDNYAAPAEKESYNPNTAVSPKTSQNSPQFGQASVQRQSEMYSPPSSPSPHYSPNQAAAPQQYPHPNIAEVDGTGVGHQAGPVRPY